MCTICTRNVHHHHQQQQQASVVEELIQSRAMTQEDVQNAQAGTGFKEKTRKKNLNNGQHVSNTDRL